MGHREQFRSKTTPRGWSKCIRSRRPGDEEDQGDCKLATNERSEQRLDQSLLSKVTMERFIRFILCQGRPKRCPFNPNDFSTRFALEGLRNQNVTHALIHDRNKVDSLCRSDRNQSLGRANKQFIARDRWRRKARFPHRVFRHDIQFRPRFQDVDGSVF